MCGTAVVTNMEPHSHCTHTHTESHTEVARIIKQRTEMQTDKFAPENCENIVDRAFDMNSNITCVSQQCISRCAWSKNMFSVVLCGERACFHCTHASGTLSASCLCLPPSISPAFHINIVWQWYAPEHYTQTQAHTNIETMSGRRRPTACVYVYSCLLCIDKRQHVISFSQNVLHTTAHKQVAPINHFQVIAAVGFNALKCMYYEREGIGFVSVCMCVAWAQHK